GGDVVPAGGGLISHRDDDGLREPCDEGVNFLGRRDGAAGTRNTQHYSLHPGIRLGSGELLGYELRRDAAATQDTPPAFFDGAVKPYDQHLVVADVPARRPWTKQEHAQRDDRHDENAPNKETLNSHAAQPP